MQVFLNVIFKPSGESSNDGMITKNGHAGHPKHVLVKPLKHIPKQYGPNILPSPGKKSGYEGKSYAASSSQANSFGSNSAPISLDSVSSASASSSVIQGKYK